ncbi:tellurite resistance TerB family protein [Endothiovibrio diazotrophicus]
MLDQILRFFEQHLTADEGPALRDAEHTRRLAVAALLLEMARMDEEVTTEESAAVERTVREQFGLREGESRALLALAEKEREASVDYFQFTRLINDHGSAEEKRWIVEALWRIAFADGHLDRYEEHLVRRLADLLYVPHADFIAAKHRALGGL